MAKQFVFADSHYLHANIIKYLKTPELQNGDLDSFGNWVSDDIRIKRAQQRDKKLIRNHNSRVKSEDTYIHIGDFICRGNERGIPGSKMKPNELLSKMNGNKIMIMGNHDSNNGLNTHITSMRMNVGGMQLLLIHNPAHASMLLTENDDAIVHGHVHLAWDIKWWETPFNLKTEPGKPIIKKKIPAINVGGMVRKDIPLEINEVIGLILRFINTSKTDSIEQIKNQP